MQKLNRWLLAVAFAALVGSAARAADVVPTFIKVEDMECKGCAKRVTTQLATIPGIAKIEPDVKSRFVKVTPKPQTVLSPKALWEAIEQVGKTPILLQGPSGTFNAKPQS